MRCRGGLESAAGKRRFLRLLECGCLVWRRSARLGAIRLERHALGIHEDGAPYILHPVFARRITRPEPAYFIARRINDLSGGRSVPAESDVNALVVEGGWQRCASACAVEAAPYARLHVLFQVGVDPQFATRAIGAPRGFQIGESLFHAKEDRGYGGSSD